MNRIDFYKWLMDFSLLDLKIKVIHIQKITQSSEYVEIIYKFGLTVIWGRHINTSEEPYDYANLREEIKNWREEIERAKNY